MTYYVQSKELGVVELGNGEHAVRKLQGMELGSHDLLFAMDGLMGRVRPESYVYNIFMQRQKEAV